MVARMRQWLSGANSYGRAIKRELSTGGSGFASSEFVVWFGVRGFGVRGSGVRGSGVRGLVWGSRSGSRSGAAFGAFGHQTRRPTARGSSMTTIRSHEELDAWRLSDNLEDRVYEITARSRARRDRDFCDDIQRSARSAPANLSEGFHRFRPRDNARFVRIAIASIGETMNHLRHAWKRKYITDQEYEEWLVLAKRARGASTGWLAYLDSCPPDGPARHARCRPDTDSEPNRAPNPEPDREH